MSDYLRRELEKMEKLRHKSRLLDLNGRNEYIEKLNYQKYLEEQVANYRAGRPIRPYGRVRRK